MWTRLKPDDEEYGLVIMKTIVENGEELLSTLDSDSFRSEIQLKTRFPLISWRYYRVKLQQS